MYQNEEEESGKNKKKEERSPSFGLSQKQTALSVRIQPGKEKRLREGGIPGRSRTRTFYGDNLKLYPLRPVYYVRRSVSTAILISQKGGEGLLKVRGPEDRDLKVPTPNISRED